MATTYVENGGAVNGSNLEYTFSFPYLKTEDVKVALNGVVQATTKYTVSTSPTKITFNNTSVDSTYQESSGAPKSGVTVRVFRDTDVDTAKAVYAAGSSIRATDLNNNEDQLLYAVQEEQNQPAFTATSAIQGDMSAADKAKLDGIEASATADQTGAEIKTAYEGESNTNAFTDAEKTKLAGIEASATADQSNSEIKTAYEANSDTNAFTDAEKTKLSGVAASANNYVHPNHSGEVTSTADGATVIADNIVDEANLKVDNSPTNDYVLTAKSSAAGGLTWAAASGGDANQNAFSNVAVSGQTTVAADSTTDTVTLVAGTNVTITTDASADSVTINAAGGSSGLSAVVGDTTPQLGGNLDVNSQDIVSTSNGDIDLDPNGSGKVVFKGNATKGAGQFKLNCENNSHGIVIKGPPHSAAASYTLTLPNDDGSANEVLKTDGSGNLDWVAQTTDTNTQLSNAEVRTAVEAATDSNVFTDADHTKLNGIAASANAYVHPNHSGEVTSTADGATVIADNIVDEANLKVSNAPTNGYVLTARSGNTGGMTWEASQSPSFVLFENAHTLSADYTIGSGNNAMAAGPLTTGSYTVTVPSGSTFTIV